MSKLLIIREVETAFKVLNEKLFGGTLETPLVVVDTAKKVSVRYLSELLVVGTEVSDLEYHDFLAVLLHEMIHIYNAQNGFVDVTANQYHNKKFLEAALAVGLVVTKKKTQGWGFTATSIPKQHSQDAVRIPQKKSVQERILAFQAASNNHDKVKFRQAKAEVSTKSGKKRPKVCFLKYVCTCPPPHNSIRSGRRPDGDHPLRIRCEVCGSLFRCELEP